MKKTTSDNMTSSDSGVADLLAAGTRNADPIELGNTPQIVIAPAGYIAIPIPRVEIAPAPDHIRQRVTLNSLDSFTAYVKKFQRNNTEIFSASNESGGSFTAVFDYHEGGKDGVPGRAVHSALYPCPLSVEWKTWLKLNSVPQKQETFVEFIDANAKDIILPDSAVLLELAMNFEMKSNVNFQSDIRRTTGGRVLKFTEEIEAGRSGSAGEIKVPDIIKIRIPVFETGKLFEIEARVEFRVNSGKLTIAYILRRAHDAVRDALTDLRKDIETATGIIPLAGSI